MLKPKVQEKIDLLKRLFCARSDVYAKLWKRADGSIGYSPDYDEVEKPKLLTDTILLSHVLGLETIGVYPLKQDNTTIFLAIDFDEADWFEDAQCVQKTAFTCGFSSYLERSRSGNGAHVWLFFTSPIPAWKARRVGAFLLTESGISRKDSYDRMFPNQDVHSGKGLGNLIALPLQGESVKKGNSCFIDEMGKAFADQWEFLRNLKVLTEEQVDDFLSSHDVSKEPEGDGAVGLPMTGATGPIPMTVSNFIEFSNETLPSFLYKFLKGKVNFSNPIFYELERRGYSTWQTPRTIVTMETEGEFIRVPRGLLGEVLDFCKKEKLILEVSDRRFLSEKIVFDSSIQLLGYQKLICRQLLEKDECILEAKPGFGKTMVALKCMELRKQKTLIIVHTHALLKQWTDRIQSSFKFKKGDLGTIGLQKWKIGNKVTVASYQTLARRGAASLENEFGLVIVDECHHVPAKTFTNVVKSLKAKYLLGLTATPYRRDHLNRLMTLYIGTIIESEMQNSEDSSEDQEAVRPIVPIQVQLRHTEFKVQSRMGSEFQKIGDSLITNVLRNELIMEDLLAALRLDGKCLILTERIEHSDHLLALLRKRIKGIHAGVLAGKLSRVEKKKLYDRIKQNRFKVLFATGKLVGEGFDWPEMDHLFLVFPFSWKGKLIQYLGRVQRAYPNKKIAHVYDYVDFNVPMLKAMYFKRLRVYRSMNLVETKKQGRPLQDTNQATLF